MRVGLDITQAVKRQGRGIARYIRCIVPRLVRDAQDLEPTFCIRGERWARRALVDDMCPQARRSWMPVPQLMTTGGLDLFHSFGNHLPAVARLPSTFTIHDFRSLDRPDKGRGGKSRLRRNIERSDGIICLTEHGRDRLVKYYPDLDPDCMAVIPHGVDHSMFYPRDPVLAMKTAGTLGLDRPFLLQLGSWFPHKNLELSIRAFAKSRARQRDYQLVFIGGGAGQTYRDELDALVRSEGLGNRVRWIDNVSGPDLPVLVSAAACLLQPSRYEGFALPLLEAMASGVPGVVSDSSCLPEVSGGIWPVAGQDDADAFAAGMDRMTLDPEPRSNAIAAGLDYAREFTWERTARETIGFFRRVLRHSR